MFNKYVAWIRIIVGLIINFLYIHVLSLVHSGHNVGGLIFDPYFNGVTVVLLNIVFVLVSSLLYSSNILGIINYTIVYWLNKYVLESGIGTALYVYMFSLILALILTVLITTKVLGMRDLVRESNFIKSFDVSILHLITIYFSILSLSLPFLYIFAYEYMKSLLMSKIGIVANAIITSTLSLRGMRKYLYIVPLGILSTLSYLALVPIIAYILSIMRPYEIFEYRLSKIITQNSEHIYFGKIKAILTYGIPRKVYQEIHHYHYKKKTWYWRVTEKPIYINLKSLPNRHILITGASGTGKSLLAKHIVREIYKKYGISFIIIDPHNEYKILRKYVPELNIVDASTLSINPLELGRLGPKEKAYQISSFVSTLFKLGPIQRHLFADLILDVYRFKGIYPDKPETWSSKPPTMHDLLEFCQRLMSNNELYKKIYPYIRILADNVFSSTNISFHDLTKTPTIVTLNGLSSDFVKALYVNALLQRILDSMYIGELRNELMMVLDEAYMFLRRGMSRNIVSKLLMESRKYGLGLIIISQQILAVPDSVVENSSIKIFFNTSEPKNLEYSSRVICSGCDKHEIIASKSALTNLKSYNYILSISGFNEIFIVNEEDIAQNMYAG